MRARRLTAAAVQAGLTLLVGGAAFAANGRFGADSDIIGLTLNMSQDDAKQLVQQSYPGAPVIELPVVLTVDRFQKKALAGFVVDLASKADAAANQNKTDQQQKEFDARKTALGDSPLSRAVGSVGDFAQDRLKVLFDPNDGATDIFAVSRYTEYATGKQPVTKTMIDALTEKYGAPSRSSGDNRTLLTYTWAGPGVLERTKASQTHCYEEAGFDFLYEGVGDAGFYGIPQLVNATGQNFVGAVNLVHGKNPNRNYSICGTVLQVRLKLTQGGDYVGALSARLIDLNKAYAELGTFGDEFFRQATEAKRNQLDKDSAAKPKL